MLKSLLCSLKDSTDNELMELGECPFDQVWIVHCMLLKLCWHDVWL
jgi:hypothetical protein